MFPKSLLLHILLSLLVTADTGGTPAPAESFDAVPGSSCSVSAKPPPAVEVNTMPPTTIVRWGRPVTLEYPVPNRTFSATWLRQGGKVICKWPKRPAFCLHSCDVYNNRTVLQLNSPSFRDSGIYYVYIEHLTLSFNLQVWYETRYVSVSVNEKLSFEGWCSTGMTDFAVDRSNINCTKKGLGVFGLGVACEKPKVECGDQGIYLVSCINQFEGQSVLPFEVTIKGRVCTSSPPKGCKGQGLASPPRPPSLGLVSVAEP